MDNIATLNYAVNIECPKCNIAFDLTDNNDNDGEITVPLFNNRWNDVKGFDVVCDNCEHEFELDGIEL